MRWRGARNGLEVPSYSVRATCWCSEGALEHVYWRESDDFDRSPYMDAMSILAGAVKGVAAISGSDRFVVTHFNDHASHGEVLSVWDEAISRAKGLEV